MIPVADDGFLETQECGRSQEDGFRCTRGSSRLAHESARGFDGVRGRWKIERGMSKVRTEIVLALKELDNMLANICRTQWIVCVLTQSASRPVSLPHHLVGEHDADGFEYRVTRAASPSRVPPLSLAPNESAEQVEVAALVHPPLSLRKLLEPTQTVGNKRTNQLLGLRRYCADRLLPRFKALPSLNENGVEKVHAVRADRFQRREVQHPFPALETEVHAVDHQCV